MFFNSDLFDRKVVVFFQSKPKNDNILFHCPYFRSKQHDSNHTEHHRCHVTADLCFTMIA